MVEGELKLVLRDLSSSMNDENGECFRLQVICHRCHPSPRTMLHLVSMIQVIIRFRVWRNKVVGDRAIAYTVEDSQSHHN